ncbi:hypothetical protein A1O3_03206 [Capronia epimyces CBS 606.96]|uniref:Uncharacterized protein n=1 Tax=Capronia epimyces CBS 606.96 TaxID=1182542 RepID=W9YB98_9EURO|nr:uncharacterized protein A1O3_03206 [Capronia epimyces CBS 606.96]EXJ90137.1 hypothetical protein A1O3_03206 [Capronia epimyces CBS 606.96]
MSEETLSSSGRRQTSRTLYPDLHSAHAQILGRRPASPLQTPPSPKETPPSPKETPPSPKETPPSPKETRFPLSPSSISSEEDEQDEFDLLPLPFGSDDIPLKDLSCRRVQSAQGVLREADHHEESSAILETSDEAEPVGPNEGRFSSTLDEIVSHYAEGPADGSSSLPVMHPNSGQGFANPEIAHPQPVRRVHVHRDSGGNAFEPPIRGHFPSGPPDEGQQEQEDRPLRSIADFEEDDGDWETVPESSRSGFLTPSRLRFRLTRETLEDSNSTFVSKTPATPWDPLSSSRRTHLEPGPALTRRPHLHGRQRTQIPPLNPLNRDDGRSSGTQQRRQIVTQTTAKPSLMEASSHRASHSASTPGGPRIQSPRIQSPRHPRPSPLHSSTRLTSHKTSLFPSSSSPDHNPISALPSSSLFPRALARELTQAHGDQSGHFDTASPGRTLDRQRKGDEFGKMAATDGSHKRLLALQLREGTYGSTDAEISRFLRDTQHLRADTAADRSSMYSSHSNVNAAQYNHSAHGTSASLLPATGQRLTFPLEQAQRSVDIQRRAGRFLLVACMATFWVGGFVLAHDMGRDGTLAGEAMAEMTRWLSGREDGVVGRVHPEDARLARAVEEVGLLVAVAAMLGCVGVLVWAATN